MPLLALIYEFQGRKKLIKEEIDRRIKDMLK